MIEDCPFQRPSTTPGASFTIADHFMQHIAAGTLELLGENDNEWVLSQLGSLHPFPPDY